MPDITYRFVASGNEDVEKAFSGIEARAKASKKATDEAARTQRASAGSRRGASVEARRPISETEKLAKEVARAQERTSKREADAAHRRDLSDLRKRSAEKRRELEKAARQEESAKNRAQREAEQRRKQSIGTLKDIAGGAFLGAVGAGTALIGAAARESMQLQEASARIAISARGAKEAFKSPDQLRRSFEQTAINTPGQTAAGVADAVQRFVSLTGDLDTALKSQGTFATIASATGANVGDIAEAAASLSQQFDVKGIDDMREALAALTFQGKNGAFEIKDMASQMQSLAASGAAFGLPKGVTGIKTLGGLTQIARTSTKSAEEASFAVSALFRQFGSKQKELKSAGVDVFKNGKVGDIRDLIIESIAKVGGKDVAKKQAGLQAIFGDEGLKGIKGLVAKYNTTFAETQGSEADKTAAAMGRLRDEFERAIDAPGTFADAEDDAAMAQQQASSRIGAAWESIKAKTADALLPSLANLAEKLADKESMLDPFIEAVGLAAEGLVALSDALGFTKQKSHAQKAKDAERELRQLERSNQTMFVSRDEIEKRKALHATIASEQAAMWTKAGPMTQEDFIAKYLAAGASGSTQTGAEQVAKGVQAGGSVYSNDFIQKNFMGETQEQKDLRHQYEGQVGQEKAEAQFNAKNAQEQLDAVTNAANKAAAALDKVGGKQGSVLAGQAAVAANPGG